MVTGVMTRMFRKRRVLHLQADPTINLRSSQADTQLGAGDLQRTNGHVENISNLGSAFSSLDEIYYLLEPFRRKLCWLATSSQGQAFLPLNCLLFGQGLTPH